ncbi:hypothetical protein B0O80DRAFT_495039 [Mortierella sp. GBAus27b]|nr:hypothetical protein BGX31_007814 [Mortierella sp. GBA43]KAI8359513.1 hypothetical protein B0O80DRAFT_495039 [Mortierella sp. GBAus27b]
MIPSSSIDHIVSTEDSVPTSAHTQPILLGDTSSTTPLARPAPPNETIDHIAPKFLATLIWERLSGLHYHPRIRLIPLCQGLWITTRNDCSLHVSDSKGYTIKLPHELENRYSHLVKPMFPASKFFVASLGLIGGVVAGVPPRLGDSVNSALSSSSKLFDNQVQLSGAGITLDSMPSVQDIVRRHQKENMKDLLLGAGWNGVDNVGNLQRMVLEDGRYIWACSECSVSLETHVPIDEKERQYMMLPQFLSLIKKGLQGEVNLPDADSVALLSDCLSNSDKRNKLAIHADVSYHEVSEQADHEVSEQNHGAIFRSIKFRFDVLGQVIQRLKYLTHLEIHGNITSGKMYAGLKSILGCRSLEVLHVSGISCFLQGKDISMECRKLKELSLQDVHLDTDQAVSNLWQLIAASPELATFKLTRARFTTSVLSMEKPKSTLRQFSRLESLELPSNGLGEQEVLEFVRMVLAGKNPGLRRLDFSGNLGIRSDACESVLKLLANKKCWLKEFEVKNTGVDMRTLESVSEYLLHSARWI